MESNELSKEDKQLISKIDELLVQLKTISQSVFELREHASLVLPDVAPIEQVEEVKTLPDFGKYLSQQEQPKSIVKEEVKERYSVTVLPFNHNINDNRIAIYCNDEELLTQQANALAAKIKALLQTL